MGRIKKAPDAELERFIIPDRYQPDVLSTLVVVREDSILVASGAKSRGATPGGKEWSRFKNSISVASWRSGVLRTYFIDTRQRRRHVAQVTSSAFPMNDARSDERLRSLLELRHAGRGLPKIDSTEVIEHKLGRGMSISKPITLGQMVQRGAFPVLSQVEGQWWSDDTLGLGSALRAANGREFVQRVYGKRHFRKDLLSAVAMSPDLRRIAFTATLRNVVPVDWIVEALKSERSHGIDHSRDRLGFAQLFATLAPTTQRRLLLEPAQNPFMASDSVRLMRYMGIEGERGIKVRDWRDLHDSLAKRSRAMGRISRAIPQTKLAAKLNGKASGGLVLAAAQQTGELEEWGNEMSNCIGGYSHAAVAGTTNLFGVYERGILIGNMEVDMRGRVVQLVGKYNGKLDAKRDETIRKMVSAK